MVAEVSSEAGRHVRIDFRVGRETPFGQALRRYWTPACLSSELARPDCDPLRLRLLGERLVAFRDSAGRVGVLDEACPHRRASLVYGRNEGGGLRCLWHQWKFAVDGTVLERPNTSDCTLKDRVSANAYPVKESGGFVWVYLGPSEHEPPFYEYGWAIAPEANRALVGTQLDCNFVKALEASLDSTHISLLHVDAVERTPAFRSTVMVDLTEDWIDPAPVGEVLPTDFGFYFGNVRQARREDVQEKQVRVSAFVAPYMVFIAPAGSVFISVPQDDDHCRFYNVKWLPVLQMKGGMLKRWIDFMGLDSESLEAFGMTPEMPGPGPLGARNRLIQDREAMRAGLTYSGLPGLNAEDAAMICSIPGISDYEGEHLVPGDIGLVKARQVLWSLSRSVMKGETPLGIIRTTPSYTINSLAASIPRAEDWKSLLPRRTATRRAAGFR